MTLPQHFTLTTDFATLKNDDETTFELTIPSSVAIGAGSTYSVSETKTVGTAGASERAQISSTKLSQRFPGSILAVDRLGSAGSYTITADLSRTGSDQLTASVTIRNPYGGAMTGESGAETFRFSVETFIPPFAAGS